MLTSLPPTIGKSTFFGIIIVEGLFTEFFGDFPPIFSAKGKNRKAC